MKEFPGKHPDFKTTVTGGKRTLSISEILICCFSVKQEPVIVSCAGSHGDDEAVLRWRKDDKEVGLMGRCQCSPKGVYDYLLSPAIQRQRACVITF